jgi:hypothetical protein
MDEPQKLLRVAPPAQAAPPAPPAGAADAEQDQVETEIASVRAMEEPETGLVRPRDPPDERGLPPLPTLRAAKTYRVDLVVRLVTPGPEGRAVENVEDFRLVLSRDGIERVETRAGGADVLARETLLLRRSS